MYLDMLPGKPAGPLSPSHQIGLTDVALGSLHGFWSTDSDPHACVANI